MTAQYPNKVPIYINGDANRDYGNNTITSSLTDQDGGDAVMLYRVGDPRTFVLARRVVVYSRGASNGAGKAIVWYRDPDSGVKQPVGQLNWDAPTERGIVKVGSNFVYLDLEDYAPALSEQLRGIIMRADAELYIQIEDSSMSDGYNVFPICRNMSYQEGFDTSP